MSGTRPPQLGGVPVLRGPEQTNPDTHHVVKLQIGQRTYDGEEGRVGEQKPHVSAMTRTFALQRACESSGSRALDREVIAAPPFDDVRNGCFVNPV